MASPTKSIVAGWVLALSLAMVLACAPDVPARSTRLVRSTGAVGANGSTCTLDEVSRHPLILPGGTEIYVEPQVIRARRGGYLIAGSPTYEWLIPSSGVVSKVNAQHFVGAFVTDGVVEIVAPPPGVGAVGWVRVAPLGGDLWGWLFQELSSPPPSKGEPTRIVYAESRGAEWMLIEDLPEPPGGELSFPTSSPLLATPEGLAWVVPIHTAGRGVGAVLFQRTSNGWTPRRLVTDWVDEVGIFYSARGLRVAVGGLDEDFATRQPSLRIHSTDSSPGLPRRIFLGQPGERVRSLRFLESPGGPVASWVVVGPHSTTAWTAKDIEAEEVVPEWVDPGVVTALPVRLSAEVMLSVVHHHDGVTGMHQLRVYRIGSGAPELVGALPYPYLGYFAVVSLGEHDLTVVGPDVDQTSANPFVRSLVLRLSVSCT